MLEVFLEPTGLVPPPHVHPRQRQRLEVLAGSLGVQAGRRRSVVGPGARLDLAPGTPHRLWNAGDEAVQLVVEVAPALQLESLLAARFAPGPRPGRRRRARIAAAHLETVRRPFPPAPLQRLALALAARF